MAYPTKMLEGRKHIVVPVVMVVEGVLRGSQGALLYPSDELRKSVPHWNGRPVVVYHPTMNGQPVSACDPDLVNKHKVGVIYNARWDTQAKALKAEAWIDPAKLSVVDWRITDAINHGRMVEVSTGLFTDNEEATGTWQGRPYTGIARNHKPDHLALLPDQIGACSIADGAGLCRNGLEGEEPLTAPAMAFA